MNKDYKLATLAVRSGYEADSTGAATMPIYPSTAFHFDSADHAANLFDLKEFGNIYSRLTNPTMDAVAARVNALDEGVGALAVSSGQAAITIALTNIVKQHEHILSVSTLYGGTHSLFSNTFKHYGIDVTFINPELSEEEILSYAKDNTKAIYAETIGNPLMNVLDIDKLSSVAKKIGVPFILDNTLATPALFRAKDHGVNIVLYSATKYLGGHGNALGGIIVDLGNFSWNNGKFPELTEPDPSYHGIQYWDTFGSLAFIIKARVGVLRDVGSALSPFNAWIIAMGIETLPLRMKKHCENALGLAQFLESHPQVTYVSYPGLASSPYHKLAKRYLPNGASGMLAFGIKGGSNAGKSFINKVELANLVANLGDNRTIVTHPASTTHRQLTEQQQIDAGVSPDMIRVSVGIEDLEDLITDFSLGLDQE